MNNKLNNIKMKDPSSPPRELAEASQEVNRRLPPRDPSFEDSNQKVKGYWRPKKNNKEKLQRVDTDDGTSIPAPAYNEVDKGHAQTRPGAAGLRRAAPESTEPVNQVPNKAHDDDSDDEEKLANENKRKVSRGKDRFANAAMAIRASTTFLSGAQASENVQRQVETLHTRIGVLEGAVVEMKDMQLSILKTLQQQLVVGGRGGNNAFNVVHQRDVPGDRFSFDDNNFN
jgi:hypothetical protein